MNSAFSVAPGVEGDPPPRLSFKDIPEIPNKFDIVRKGIGTYIMAFVTFLYSIRPRIYRFAQLVHTFRDFMKSSKGPGPELVRIGTNMLVACGNAGMEVMEKERSWDINKVDKVFPFNSQHMPHIKSANYSILFTSIEKKDWDFHVARSPFKDENLIDKWLPGTIRPMSIVASEIIEYRSRPDVGPTDAQDFFQKLIFACWRHMQFGPDLPEDLMTYEEFISIAHDVDSGIGSVCCPYASRLGIFHCIGKGVAIYAREAQCIRTWIKRYQADHAFRAARCWTLLGTMIESPSFAPAVEADLAWGEKGHPGGYGLEISLSFLSDLYGGVLSGASVLITALNGLQAHEDVCLKMMQELTNLGAGSLETVTLKKLNRSRELNKVIAESFRQRHPVPMLSRVVTKEGGISIQHHEIPQGTRIVVAPRADMYDPMYGSDPEEFRPSRWDDKEGMYENVALKWETGVPGFMPFGAGVRRCNGRKLAHATLQCIIARVIMQSQFVFDGMIKGYEKERWLYGVCSYKSMELALSDMEHKQTSKQDDISCFKFSMSGVGMGFYCKAMSLLVNIGRPSTNMKNVKIADVDCFEIEPKVDVIKADKTTIYLNADDNPNPSYLDQLAKDIAEACFHCMNSSSFHEDEGPSFQSELEELVWVKEAYPDIMTSYSLTAGGSFWPGGASDIGTARLFTHGLGSTLLVHKGDHLEVDLRSLSTYDVREIYEPHGCRAVFNLKGYLMSIEKNGKMYSPRDKEDWSKAKLCLRSSTIIYITLREHLTYTHLRVANSTLLALRRHLAKDHVINRFLQPFLFNTLDINQGAKLTLIPFGSLAHRLSAMTEEVYHKAFSDVYESWVFETFAENIKRRGMDKVSEDFYPFRVEGQAFWDCVEEFVKKFVYINYETEKEFDRDEQVKGFCKALSDLFNVPPGYVLDRDYLVLLLTMHIFWVTGMHNFAGGQLAYLIQTPFLVPPNIRKWDKENKTQLWTELLPPQRMIMTEWTLVAMTQGENPQLREDFSHLVIGIPKEKEMTKLIRDFTKNKLGKLAAEIEIRNKMRQWPLRMFHPDLLLSSVSV